MRLSQGLILYSKYFVHVGFSSVLQITRMAIFMKVKIKISNEKTNIAKYRNATHKVL